MSVQFRYYAKELLNIALPIIMGNLGFILIGAGDVLVAGHHSTDTLAAISIATAITNCIQTFGVGLISSVSPLLSNFRGEKKSAKKYFYPTIRFAMLLAFIIMLAVLAFIPVIDYLHFAPKLVPMIKEYMFITAFATFGAYLHSALKEFLQAFEIVVFPNLITAIAVFLNIALCFAMVFGFGPIPSMGVVGLAVASFIIRYFMGFALLIYCFTLMNFKDHKDFEYYKSLIRIGIPISCAVMVEFIAFNSIAILMGRVDGVYAAAQNLVCTLTTISFMVPFAVSNAIAVKVGFANGAGNIKDLKRYSFVGIVICTGFMMLSALVFSTFPHFLVGLFSQDANLIKISVPILYILAIFQVFDGLQISLAGIFKGMKRTGVVLLSNFIAYWLISIPVGYTLAFHYHLNLKGFWIGLASAAVILCAIMSAMLIKSIKNLETVK